MAQPLTLTSGNLTLQVDPSCGGRVVQLSYAGTPLLVGPDVNPTNFGATYWTSPQADWGWPPVRAVDEEPYEVRAVGPTTIHLRSGRVELGQRRFHIDKEFSVFREGCIDVAYGIENVGTTPFSMASWEISRVGPGGLTFFPTGELELSPISPHGEMSLEKHGAMSVYDHERFALGRSLKLHADGRDGFLAHLAREHLLLKLFRDSPASAQAPGEGEIELFANEDGRYVEVEVQGPYVELAPGGCSRFEIRTVVLPVPADQRKAREQLFDFARRQARSLSGSPGASEDRAGDAHLAESGPVT